MIEKEEIVLNNIEIFRFMIGNKYMRHQIFDEKIEIFDELGMFIIQYRGDLNIDNPQKNGFWYFKSDVDVYKIVFPDGSELFYVVDFKDTEFGKYNEYFVFDYDIIPFVKNCRIVERRKQKNDIPIVLQELGKKDLEEHKRS